MIKATTDLAFNWALVYNKTLVYRILVDDAPFKAFEMQKTMSNAEFKQFLRDYHRDVIANDPDLSNTYVPYLVGLRHYQ